ncbi:MAG: hypothetical protein Q7S80_02405 [bacterium]|nr:hypothetical protein [bacterium]
MSEDKKTTHIPIELRLAESEDKTRIEVTIRIYLPPEGWSRWDPNARQRSDMEFFERTMTAEVYQPSTFIYGDWHIPQFRLRYTRFIGRGSNKQRIEFVRSLGARPERAAQIFRDEVVRPEARKWVQQIGRFQKYEHFEFIVPDSWTVDRKV